MKARHLLAIAFAAPANLLAAQEEPPPTFPVRSEIVILDVEPGRRFYRARFSALVLVRDRGGRVVSRLSHDWPLRGPSVELESARGRTASVKRRLELPPGEYVVESAVGDRLAGLLGVEREPLVVP